MHDFGFFISIALVGCLAYGLSSFLDARRRQRRRDIVESRASQSDGEFRAAVSSLNPVSLAFCRAFRLAVGRALGVDYDKLDPQDRISQDLRVFGFDAMELAATLERGFDVRVRVTDVMRSGTLRKLALVIHERLQEISEYEPPLHREPVPHVPAPVTAPITPNSPGTVQESTESKPDLPSPPPFLG